MNSPSQNAPAPGGWLITFADLLSLMLTFFVLLFSMSTIEYENWEAVVVTMSEEFSQKRPKLDITPRDSANQLQPKKAAGLNLNYLQALLQRSIDSHASFEGVTIQREQDRLLISFPAALLFENKDSEVIIDGTRPLQRLVGTLVQIKNKIRIAGHTNAAPVSSGKFRSNWELSMARARIVAGILTDFGYTRPMTVLGYGDTIPSNLGPAQSERVDVEIVTEKGGKGLYGIF